MTERLYLFDTTLRDGQQTQGVQFSTAEKCQIALNEAKVFDLFPDRSTQQLVQRQFCLLTDGVPEGQFDAGQGLGEVAWRAAGALGVEAVLVVVPDDPVCIISGLSGEMRNRVVQNRQHRGDHRTCHRFANADNSGIGFHLN